MRVGEGGSMPTLGISRDVFDRILQFPGSDQFEDDVTLHLGGRHMLSMSILYTEPFCDKFGQSGRVRLARADRPLNIQQMSQHASRLG